MKSGQLFWGFFLLSIGALFLLTKYEFIYSDFCFVWDIWPLIFVLWGGMVIFKNGLVKPILSALMGILLGLILFGFMTNVFCAFNFNGNFDEDDYQSQTFIQEYNDTIKQVNFELSTGAGTFEITGQTDKLIDGKASGLLADYDFIYDTEDTLGYINLNLEDGHFNFSGGKLKNHLRIAFNSKPVWDFNLNFGAAKARFDLSEYKARNVSLKTGAANVKLKLGDKFDSTSVDVEMGAASLRIEVPQNSGCRVEGEMVLMSRSFEGFNKIASDYYETPGFDNAAKKIFIRVDGGVSSFKVVKY